MIAAHIPWRDRGRPPRRAARSWGAAGERASRHGIALRLDLDPRLGEIVGDERKVKQVLLNLLSNAVKFTSEPARRTEPSQYSCAPTAARCPLGPGPYDRSPRLPEHGHELTPAVWQRERDDLLRVPAPVHVAHHLVGFPAHVLQVLRTHVERPDDPAALGQSCVGSPGQWGGTMP